MEKTTTILVPQQLQESKNYKKVEKIFGDAEARAFYQKTAGELEDVIVACETQQAQARADVEENPKYIAAKAVMKDLNGALAEINKPLKAKKAAAAEILNYRDELARIPIEGDDEVVEAMTVMLSVNGGEELDVTERMRSIDD